MTDIILSIKTADPDAPLESTKLLRHALGNKFLDVKVAFANTEDYNLDECSKTAAQSCIHAFEDAHDNPLVKRAVELFNKICDFAAANSTSPPESKPQPRLR